MARPVRKPEVRPETVRAWVRLHQAEGRSAPQIAKDAGYDVRTVRKYLAMAEREREDREDRSAVRRLALEKHYEDLVEFVGKVQSNVVSPTRLPLPGRDERLYAALKEHLPRSPLWKALDKWDQLHQERLGLEKSAGERMLKEVQQGGALGLSKGRPSLGFRQAGLSAVAAARLAQVARATKEQSSAPWPVLEERMDSGLINLSWDAWSCALAPPDTKDEIAALIGKLLNDIAGGPEVNTMRRVLVEIGKVTAAIEEELETLQLRRIVPGRCKYCPF